MTDNRQNKRIDRPVIFFDGVCGMCNSFVNLVKRVDRKEQFYFAPLQGQTAKDLLPPLPKDPKQWSMIYLDESGVHEQSDASLEVYRRLGGALYVLSLLRYVPRVIRDPAYRVLARNRYALFGRRDQCRMPAQEEERRFLP